MLTYLLINAYVYSWIVFDQAISIIPGMSTVQEYTSNINTAINSVFGTLHSIAPSTFSLFAQYVTLWLFTYITYYVVKKFALFIPFVS